MLTVKIKFIDNYFERIIYTVIINNVLGFLKITF